MGTSCCLFALPRNEKSPRKERDGGSYANVVFFVPDVHVHVHAEHTAYGQSG